MMKETSKLTYVSPNDPPLKSVMIRSIERLTGQRKLEQLYTKVVDDRRDKTSFWAAALEQLQLNVEYDEAQLAKVPRCRPVVFIANHPYGVLDGIIICHLAARTRQRFKILINRALCQEEQVAPYFLPIDFSETEEAVRINLDTKRRALEILRRRGAIVIFPAGGISTSKGPLGQAIDLEWKLFAAKLIQMTRATVVPIYFHGQNSRIFQIVSQFSLTLRLSLIIHEVTNKIGKTIRVTIGDPIPYESIANIKGRKELTDYLRQVTYDLSKD
ncbi:MAG: lysophospholipid acyltransferase family protein [Chloroflexota bacterium]